MNIIYNSSVTYSGGSGVGEACGTCLCGRISAYVNLYKQFVYEFKVIVVGVLSLGVKKNMSEYW